MFRPEADLPKAGGGVRIYWGEEIIKVLGFPPICQLPRATDFYMDKALGFALRKEQARKNNIGLFRA